jgi:IS605 OrfB family transposase
MVDKIGNIARHYDADVVTGRLNTSKFRSKRNKKSTRKIRQMPQYKFRQLLKSKLTRRGIKVTEYSEAYTSKGGVKLASFLGLDVHKCAALLFALKVINYSFFKELVAFLVGIPSNEGTGSLRRKRKRENGLTAPGQDGWKRILTTRSRVKFWAAMMLFLRNGGYSVIPGSWGFSFVESLKSTFAFHPLKVG